MGSSTLSSGIRAFDLKAMANTRASSDTTSGAPATSVVVPEILPVKQQLQQLRAETTAHLAETTAQIHALSDSLVSSREDLAALRDMFERFKALLERSGSGENSQIRAGSLPPLSGSPAMQTQGSTPSTYQPYLLKPQTHTTYATTTTTIQFPLSQPQPTVYQLGLGNNPSPPPPLSNVPAHSEAPQFGPASALADETETLRQHLSTAVSDEPSLTSPECKTGDVHSDLNAPPTTLKVPLIDDFYKQEFGLSNRHGKLGSFDGCTAHSIPCFDTYACLNIGNGDVVLLNEDTSDVNDDSTQLPMNELVDGYMPDNTTHPQSMPHTEDAHSGSLRLVEPPEFCVVPPLACHPPTLLINGGMLPVSLVSVAIVDTNETEMAMHESSVVSRNWRHDHTVSSCGMLTAIRLRNDDIKSVVVCTGNSRTPLMDVGEFAVTTATATAVKYDEGDAAMILGVTGAVGIVPLASVPATISTTTSCFCPSDIVQQIRGRDTLYNNQFARVLRFCKCICDISTPCLGFQFPHPGFLNVGPDANISTRAGLFDPSLLLGVCALFRYGDQMFGRPPSSTLYLLKALQLESEWCLDYEIMEFEVVINDYFSSKMSVLLSAYFQNILWCSATVFGANALLKLLLTAFKYSVSIATLLVSDILMGVCGSPRRVLALCLRSITPLPISSSAIVTVIILSSWHEQSVFLTLIGATYGTLRPFNRLQFLPMLPGLLSSIDHNPHLRLLIDFVPPIHGLCYAAYFARLLDISIASLTMHLDKFAYKLAMKLKILAMQIEGVNTKANGTLAIDQWLSHYILVILIAHELDDMIHAPPFLVITLLHDCVTEVPSASNNMVLHKPVLLLWTASSCYTWLILNRSPNHRYRLHSFFLPYIVHAPYLLVTTMLLSCVTAPISAHTISHMVLRGTTLLLWNGPSEFCESEVHHVSSSDEVDQHPVLRLVLGNTLPHARSCTMKSNPIGIFFPCAFLIEKELVGELQLDVSGFHAGGLVVASTVYLCPHLLWVAALAIPLFDDTMIIVRPILRLTATSYAAFVPLNHLLLHLSQAAQWILVLSLTTLETNHDFVVSAKQGNNRMIMPEQTYFCEPLTHVMAPMNSVCWYEHSLALKANVVRADPRMPKVSPKVNEIGVDCVFQCLDEILMQFISIFVYQLLVVLMQTYGALPSCLDFSAKMFRELLHGNLLMMFYTVSPISSCNSQAWGQACFQGGYIVVSQPPKSCSV